MALNDKFTFQEIDMDKKDLSYNINTKQFEAYLINECKEHFTNNNCKVYYD